MGNKKLGVILTLPLVLAGLFAGPHFVDGAEDQFRMALEKARSGDREAQLDVGNTYFNGIGVKQNRSEGLKWIREAAEQRLSEAQYKLGMIYESELSIQKDYLLTEAANWYRKAAEQDHSEAQFRLGGLYYFGKGVRQDSGEAAKWWFKAAESGNTSAQYNIAGMFHNGTGVQVDHGKAMYWYRKAAEKKHPWAVFYIGEMYRDGQGVVRSEHAAADWYYKAGLLHLKSGNREWALAAVDAIEEVVPGHFLGQKLLEEIYVKHMKTSER